MLNTWLEGERSMGFCRFLSEKSSMLKPNEIPHCKHILQFKFKFLVVESILRVQSLILM